MSLRWKKDGTAKCGPFLAYVDTVTAEDDWHGSIYTDRGDYYRRKCHAILKRGKYLGWSTEREARKVAEAYLRAQVKAMQRDLKEGGNCD